MRRVFRPACGGLFLSAGLLACLLALGYVPGAAALDLFTLWRQPEIPLNLEPGSWVDYRSQVMAGGRREESLTRVVCLPPPPGSPAGSLVLEILPLVEDAGGKLEPMPGEGTWLLVSGEIRSRRGSALDAVREIWRWREGVGRRSSRQELLDDPLVRASLDSDFQADRIETGTPTNRIVSGRQFLCDQLVLTAADSQSVDLPAGRLVQVTNQEITVAVNAEIPLLGLAFASERIRAESTLDPPGDGKRLPPPRMRVEVMELVGFGSGAQPRLGTGD
ncbi:MAG: hypothetical protein AB7V45_15415 [Candidatus Krumholzibacteriia bacterium]